MSRAPIERIDDILAAIDAITAASGVLARHASDSGVDEVVLAAVQWHVFVIGEAVKALPDDLTAATIGEPLEQLRAAAERIRRELEG